MIGVAGEVVVRPLAGDAEVAAYFALAAATFPGYHRTHCTPRPGGDLGAGWRAFVEGAPDFEPAFLRGAFVDGRLIGGYQHDERRLIVDGVPVRSGYVGGVVTDPAYRGRGAASALMRDGVAFARERGQALLVLRGIADFYGRFGYVDVMEVAEHAVERARVLAEPAPGYGTRPATLDDASALLALYQRHYGHYTGSYQRTLDEQRRLLEHRTAPPTIAVDAGGWARGYLLLPEGPAQARAVEAAADDWSAALALLRHHAAAEEASDELVWPLPSDSATCHELVEHLPVRSETRSRPNAGWMARLGDPSALVDALVPVWRAHWRRLRCGWTGALAIETDADEIHVQLAADDLRLTDEPRPGARMIRLGAGRFVQLVFGRRPARLVGESAEVAAVLDALFPARTAWYPASSRC